MKIKGVGIHSRVISVSVLILICITLGALFGFINASTSHTLAEDGTHDELTFLLNEDSKSYRVRIADKTLSRVVIPSTYNGLPVGEIATKGF